MTQRKAKEIMTRAIIEAKEDWPIDRLAEFLIENSVSGVPVTSEKGKLIGVVSLTDIVRYDTVPVKNVEPHSPHAYYLHAMERDYTPAEITSFHMEGESMILVRDIMTSMIFSVDEDTTIHQVADTMVRGHIHRIFVTREGKVVGVISALDILKTVL